MSYDLKYIKVYLFIFEPYPHASFVNVYNHPSSLHEWYVQDDKSVTVILDVQYHKFYEKYEFVYSDQDIFSYSQRFLNLLIWHL